MFSAKYEYLTTYTGFHTDNNAFMDQRMVLTNFVEKVGQRTVNQAGT